MKIIVNQIGGFLYRETWMIILSFQYIFEEVIESSLDFKFKFIVPSVEKTNLFFLKKNKI